MQISVKAARVNANMTQSEAAKALGISLKAYNLKENGRTKFYADELAQLSTLFNIPLLNFFEAQCRDATRDA